MCNSSANHVHLEAPSQSTPTPGYFTLSRELRDYCYELALITPLPIVVWSSIRPGNEGKENAVRCREDMQKAEEHRAKTVDIRALLSSLLRCNSTIAREAALVFYGRNRFYFCGDWTWTTILTWWEDIGPINRGSVSHLELRIRRPTQAYEELDGHRTIDSRTALEPAYPRSPYLLKSPHTTWISPYLLTSNPTHFEVGKCVESIDPAIETFFELIHKRPSISKQLSIDMCLHQGYLPGFQLDIDDMWPWTNYFTMDLPNIMEKLCEKGPNVEVLWKGLVTKDGFLTEKSEIEKLWHILSIKDEDLHLQRWKELHFVVKRREIKGLPYAATPAPKPLDH